MRKRFVSLSFVIILFISATAFAHRTTYHLATPSENGLEHRVLWPEDAECVDQKIAEAHISKTCNEKLSWQGVLLVVQKRIGENDLPMQRTIKIINCADELTRMSKGL